MHCLYALPWMSYLQSAEAPYSNSVLFGLWCSPSQWPDSPWSSLQKLYWTWCDRASPPSLSYSAKITPCPLIILAHHLLNCASIFWSDSCLYGLNFFLWLQLELLWCFITWRDGCSKLYSHLGTNELPLECITLAAPFYFNCILSTR